MHVVITTQAETGEIQILKPVAMGRKCPFEVFHVTWERLGSALWIKVAREGGAQEGQEMKAPEKGLLEPKVTCSTGLTAPGTQTAIAGDP